MHPWLDTVLALFSGRSKDREAAARREIERYETALTLEVSRHEQTRKDFALLQRESNRVRRQNRILMADRQKLSQEMKQELQSQLDDLRNELGSVIKKLEVETKARKDCQERLASVEADNKQMKGQIQVLLEHDKARGQVNGGS